MADRDIAPPERVGLLTRIRLTTPARVALARTGLSIGTRDHLAFQLAHAQARDAVHEALDEDALRRDLESVSIRSRFVSSQAVDRLAYLARPDLGRRLSAPARDAMATEGACDIAFVIADGLSARAVQSHAAPLLARLLPPLSADGFATGAATIVQQGRVAVGDEIGELLRASLVCLLIGERPGLSSPDSLGVYLTWSPKVGRTDAERNCVSNIRLEGLSYDEAAGRCLWLIREAFQRGLTGVALKDLSDAATSLVPSVPPTRLGS